MFGGLALREPNLPPARVLSLPPCNSPLATCHTCTFRPDGIPGCGAVVRGGTACTAWHLSAYMRWARMMRIMQRIMRCSDAAMQPSRISPSRSHVDDGTARQNTDIPRHSGPCPSPTSARCAFHSADPKGGGAPERSLRCRCLWGLASRRVGVDVKTSCGNVRSLSTFGFGCAVSFQGREGGNALAGLPTP